MNPAAKTLLKAAAVIGIAASVAKVISEKTTSAFMKEAIDRKEPDTLKKIKDKLPLSKQVTAAYEETKESRERLKEMPELEKVEILSHDGLRLVGHYYACENAERTLLAVHGWRSAWYIDFGGIYPFFFKNRCNVLFIEQRAQGESEGDCMGFGLTERYDCLDWTKWLLENKSSNLPIYLVGVSMGASTILMAAGLELPKEIHGIIADCGFTSPKAIFKHVCTNTLHLNYEIRQSIVNDYFKQKLDQLPEEVCTTDILHNSHLPVMLIHGTGDNFVPISMTYENYQAANEPKRLLIVPGAEHGLSYVLEPEKYEEEVKRFWKDFDSYQTT